jgi:CRISPR-associated endoribonuclease Cas6
MGGVGVLISVIDFDLRAVSGGGLPWFVGHECRAGFISLVSRLDPELGRVFHEGVGGRSVFSLKPLRFVSGFSLVFPEESFRRFPVDGNVVFEPGARALMSVTIFNDDLAGKLLSKLFSSVQSLNLVVKNYGFSLERLGVFLIDPNEALRSGEVVDEVDIDFMTPTYFNPLRGDMSYKVLYPDPTLLFASLISIAHQLTGASYPKPEELASHVYVSGLDIKTPYVREVTQEAPTGFVGWAKIKIKKNVDSEVKKILIGLLRLGEVTNVGGNRSGGYGVIKLKLSSAEPKRQTPSPSSP